MFVVRGVFIAHWVLHYFICVTSLNPVTTQVSIPLIPIYFIFKKILFIYSLERERERERERQRHRQREKQVPSREPDVGLDLGTPGS